MKKLFILAALSVALNASADDQFIYWMIGEGATLDGNALESGDYYAKVSTGYGSGNYLNLYDSPDATSDGYGEVYTVNYNSTYGSWETFAGFASEDNIPAKLFVELYADSDCKNWIGGGDLEYTIGNITGGGMGHADVAVATTFQSVPEPTSGMLLLLGVAGLALRRKNKKA